MTPVRLLVAGFAALLTACAPSPSEEQTQTSEQPKEGHDQQVVRQAARNMASTVADLQANPGQQSSALRSVGDLWIEVDRLKREGQDVKNVEWYVSELEENLRGNRRDDTSRRHILNNLSDEVEALSRRRR